MSIKQLCSRIFHRTHTCGAPGNTTRDHRSFTSGNFPLLRPMATPLFAVLFCAALFACSSPGTAGSMAIEYGRYVLVPDGATTVSRYNRTDWGELPHSYESDTYVMWNTSTTSSIEITGDIQVHDWDRGTNTVSPADYFTAKYYNRFETGNVIAPGYWAGLQLSFNGLPSISEFTVLVVIPYRDASGDQNYTFLVRVAAVQTGKFPLSKFELSLGDRLKRRYSKRTGESTLNWTVRAAHLRTEPLDGGVTVSLYLSEDPFFSEDDLLVAEKAVKHLPRDGVTVTRYRKVNFKVKGDFPPARFAFARLTADSGEPYPQHIVHDYRPYFWEPSGEGNNKKPLR